MFSYSLSFRSSLTPFFLLGSVLVAPLAVFAEAIPDPPEIKATAYILQDYNSGLVLAEENADKPIEPASLTKMMTSYVVEAELKRGAIKASDPVKISRKARQAGGSRMFVEEGKSVPVSELVQGLIVQSGNDASIALAEHIAGSEENFASLLNAYAQKLGMTNTHFANATGLPHKEHRSTVRDLAILSARLIRDFPEHYSLYGQKEYTHNGITQSNRNLLLWRDPTVDGIKTGHTETAGFCLAASAQRDGMRLISVVVGTQSDKARATESQKLLTYGFRFYETHKLYGAQASLTQVRVWKGDKEQLPLGITEDLYVTIPRGSYKKLKATLSVNDQIVAPVPAGHNLGTVNISLGKEPLAQRDLVALQPITRGGLFRNMVDEVLLVFE